MVGFDELQKLAFETANFRDRHGVHQTARRNVKHQHLLFHRQGHVLILLQNFREPLAARKLSLCHLVQLI